jgi:hypothetical protein
MKRHDIDVISLVSGLLFAGLGIVFALHALGAFSLDVRAVPAVVLIVLGLAGISAAVRASTDRVEPESAGSESQSSRSDGLDA